MLGFKTTNTPITGNFAKEIREKLLRINTGSLNESDKSEILRTQEVLKRFVAHWK
jgi:hypothetical protein